MSQQLPEQQRRHWDTVAAGWSAWLDWTERNFTSVTQWLATAAGWTCGARVLDTACGAGYPSLAAAACVAPDGQITATDLSAEMVAVASRHASARGLRNIVFRQTDSEHLAFDEASFDAVMNAYGLMFSPDPASALAQARRIVKPGSHLAIVVWGEYDRSPFFHVITNAARHFLGLAVPPPSAPGPFRFARADAIEALLRSAGFARWRVDAVEMTLSCASVDEYVQLFRDIAWGSRIDALAPEARDGFKLAVADAARP